MKVRICFTVNVTDEFRKALNSYIGLPGMATRERIKQHYVNTAFTEDDDILDEYEDSTQEDSTEYEDN